jgi:hypothetical protein
MNMDYDDTYHFIKSKEIINSKNEVLRTTYSYPCDFPAVPVYQQMVQRNILTPVIEQSVYKDNSFLSSTKTNYGFWNSGTGSSIGTWGSNISGSLTIPQSVETQTLNNTPQVRLNYYAYDANGNVLSVGKTDNAKQSYIWDYSGSLPIAECINADAGSFAYTSFESNGTGGLSGINSSYVVSTYGGITGDKYYNQSSFSLSKSGLSSGTSYTVTYWSKSGAYSINGSGTGYPKTLNTSVVNGQTWTLYEHVVTGQTTITISGSGAIDELRLYPSNAQMTTYTHQPLIGMSSQCDANNRIIYYEYDDFNRLKIIRNQEHNILKMYDYKFQR